MFFGMTMAKTGNQPETENEKENKKFHDSIWGDSSICSPFQFRVIRRKN
jgi:hypothetical protein